MPIRLGDGWRDRGRIGNWRLPGEPAFANSRAFQLLIRDLQRYLREEIAGRSFLIAGHRGAGKTATVSQALREIRNDILLDSEKAPVLGRRGRLQRPLMVKLVGEGLIAPPPELQPTRRPPEKDREKDKDKEKEPAKGKPAGGDKGEDDAPAANGGDRKADSPRDEVASALVHITIALYRALAGEVIEAFSVHALEGSQRDRYDRLEMAAQLALELDGTPEPGTLRSYWARVGRLSEGVFWPPDSDEALRPVRFPDQGFREIVAVATAAQAFQVCSGAVTYSVTSQDSASNESKTEAGLDVKELVNRLGSLGAGALAGGAVGAQEGALAGVGTGLLVLMASAATLRWTGSRQRKSERKLDYTFLRDRSIQTLDRDLPLVIERIRAAGLAPVFVIDELDKLDDQAKTIAAIIKRLKHLVSDHGFFCFLTNRDYFDEIEQKVMDEAYPTEHTYFGERVLILNRPLDLFDYVVGLVQPDSAGETGHSLRTSVFALAVMFRAKLHFSDLSREIDRLILRDNSLIVPDQDLQAPGRFRLEATIQLAINEVLATDETMERFRSDPGFAQLAIDALYYIPRRWQNNSDAPVNIGEAALEKALLERRQSREDEAEEEEAAPKPAAAGPGRRTARSKPPAKAKVLSPISPPDLRELAAMVRRLAGYLEDLASLKRALAARSSALPPEQRRIRLEWADIVVDAKRRLIELVGVSKDSIHYRFALDELAREIPLKKFAKVEPTVRAPPSGRKKSGATPRRSPSRPREEADSAAPPAPPSKVPPAPVSADLLEAISGLVSAAELSIGDLVANRLLPATVSDTAFNATLADIRLAQQDPRQVDAALRAADGELAFRHAFEDHGTNLARALIMLAYAVEESGSSDTPGVILARIGRYLGPDSVIDNPSTRPVNMEWARMQGSPGSIADFEAMYRRWRSSLGITPIPANAMVPPEAWDRWRDRVIDFIRRGRALHSVTVDYGDIVSAARNEAPGRLFRSSLIEMDQADWSRAVLASLPREDEVLEGPYWLLFAALVALGFDGAALHRLAQAGYPDGTVPPVPERRYVDEIIRHAPARPPGVFHVYPDGVGSVAPREIPASKPMLSIGESDYPSYMSSLHWLVSHGLFDEGRDEIN